ncbi:28S ribosomal protein S26, mitochondrial [Protopterus annectens]|uniref:28S ribosomal protein S26, mitochondrial n=1 Tax=Protopterus annectens TaxID=7888 RepID=UPI001CFB7018|nr:28S ribosomal protein S26, mitochondrial [Protopterus annectens]
MALFAGVAAALSRSVLPQSCRCGAPLGASVWVIRGRKSRNDPPAKSKAGRIKEPPPVDPVELLVVQERYRQYQVLIKALRAEFKAEVLRKKYDEEVGYIALERAKQEAEEHKQLMAWNDAENKRLQELRNNRIQKEEKAKELQKLEAAIYRDKKQEELIREKEREILQLQEEAKNFITLENLEQRIEAALDNPKSYNFAIDKEGRIVKRTAHI